MKNLWYLYGILSLMFITYSCEKTIEFKSHQNSYTSASELACINDSCPAIDLQLMVLDHPKVLTDPVTVWTHSTIYNIMGISQEQTSLEDAILKYINDSQIAYPESSKLSTAHELLIDTQLSYQSNDLISINLQGYKFSGGAHGYDYEMYANFNPKTGNQYSPQELLKEGFYAFAKAKLAQKFTNRSLSDSPENFLQIGFTDNGAVIIYNDLGENAIASENIKIEIPWDEVEEYLLFN